jgi:DNA helicase-2/ATP-dependent DNA helicase PcrA
MYELGLLAPPVKAEVKKQPLPERLYKPTPDQINETAVYNVRETHYSFTKLSTYNDCPWKYRYAFVLKVPKRGSHVLSYGSSMHKTLFNFFTLWKERQKDAETTAKTPVSLTELLTMYERAFIDEWYPSKKARQEYYDKGAKALTAWFAITIKNTPNILKLEQSFNLKVDEFVINGAIDRVDQIGIDEKTKKPQVKIVDYKTGKVKEKFDKDDKYQLLIYTLAVQDPNIIDGQVKELEYYFIDANESRKIEPTEKDATAALDWVRESVKSIQSGDFRATPNEHMCNYCDYRDICEYRAV